MKHVRHDYLTCDINSKSSPTREKLCTNQNAEDPFSRITLVNDLSRAQEAQSASNVPCSLDPHAHMSDLWIEADLTNMLLF
jgi:hypothetical protein